MRILLLSQYYMPEPVPKPHELAAELVKRGHEVTVLTGQPNYPRGEIYDGYKAASRRDEIIDGVKVHRLPIYTNHSLSASRILNYFSFVISAVWWARRLNIKADLMYVYHPPLTLAWPAVRIASKLKIPYAYSVHDLWPESIEAVGVSIGNRTRKFFKKLEEMAYRGASKVIVANPGFLEHLVGKGVPREKLIYLPNWADEDIYQPVEVSQSLRSEIAGDSEFVVLYGGNVGAAQELDTLLDAAAQLRDRPDIRFVIVGDGVERERLEARAAAEGLASVRFLGRRAASEMAAYYAAADVLYCGLRDVPLFRITIPSKIFSYMACGKPSIGSLAGDGSDLITENQIGWVCPPSDGSALAKTIAEVKAKDAGERDAIGKHAREVFDRSFSKTVLINAHEKLFGEILSANQSRTG